MPSPRLKNPAKCVLQVPLQNVPLDTSDDKPHKTLDLGPFQQPGNKKLRTSSQKAEPIRMGYFHNRHIFQQQLIEKQKKKLQEQQKTILELKKNQQLAEVPQAVGHGDARSCLLSNPREDEQERTCQRLSKYVHFIVHFLHSLFVVFHFVVERLLNFTQTPQSPFFFYCALVQQRSPIHCDWCVIANNR